MKLVFPVVLVCLAAAQTDQYPRERENVLHPTNPAWRLFQDDTACGGYLWKSDHKSELHRIALYYFFGSADYGKGRMGLYPQSLYRVVANEERDPPTARVVPDGGSTKEVQIK